MEAKRWKWSRPRMTKPFTPPSGEKTLVRFGNWRHIPTKIYKVVFVEADEEGKHKYRTIRCNDMYVKDGSVIFFVDYVWVSDEVEHLHTSCAYCSDPEAAEELEDDEWEALYDEHTTGLQEILNRSNRNKGSDNRRYILRMYPHHMIRRVEEAF